MWTPLRMPYADFLCSQGTRTEGTDEETQCHLLKKKNSLQPTLYENDMTWLVSRMIFAYSLRDRSNPWFSSCWYIHGVFWQALTTQWRGEPQLFPSRPSHPIIQPSSCLPNRWSKATWQKSFVLASRTDFLFFLFFFVGCLGMVSLHFFAFPFPLFPPDWCVAFSYVCQALIRAWLMSNYYCI